MSRADDPPPRPDLVPAASRAVDLSDAARRAQALIDGGELPAALDVLRMAISGASLDGDDPQAQLADACRLYAGVLAALGETYTATPYAAYAHAACARLFAPTDPRSMHADATYAYVLRVTGYPVDAVVLHRDLVERLDKRFGAHGRPALAGHADFAVALHAAGECVEAKRVLRRAYVAYRDTFGGADPEGIRMLARLAAMTRDCGGFEKAHQYFDRARALCAEHLPHGDPLTRNVTALARAGIDERHVCGEPSVTVVARAGRPGPVVRRSPDGSAGPASRSGAADDAPPGDPHGPSVTDMRADGDARPAETSTRSRMPARPDASARPGRPAWPNAPARPADARPEVPSGPEGSAGRGPFMPEGSAGRGLSGSEGSAGRGPFMPAGSTRLGPSGSEGSNGHGPDATTRSSGPGWPEPAARPNASRPDASARATGPGWTDAPARPAGRGWTDALARSESRPARDVAGRPRGGPAPLAGPPRPAPDPRFAGPPRPRGPVDEPSGRPAAPPDLPEVAQPPEFRLLPEPHVAPPVARRRISGQPAAPDRRPPDRPWPTPGPDRRGVGAPDRAGFGSPDRADLGPPAPQSPSYGAVAPPGSGFDAVAAARADLVTPDRPASPTAPPIHDRPDADGTGMALPTHDRRAPSMPDRTAPPYDRAAPPTPDRPTPAMHDRPAADRFGAAPPIPPPRDAETPYRPSAPWGSPPNRPAWRERDHSASSSRDGQSDWSDMSEHADDVNRGNPAAVERAQPQAGRGVATERAHPRTDDTRARPPVSRDMVPRSEAVPPAYPKSGVDGVVDPVLGAGGDTPPARAPQATFGRVRRANRSTPTDPSIHIDEWTRDDRP